MASKGIPNETLKQILLDLDQVLNQDFSVLYGKGNEELDAVSKQLGGLLVQTNDIRVNDFHNAKSYFIKQGSSEEAATTLGLVIANIAKLSGETYDSVIREITDRGIEFSDETYLKINNLRQPESQLFKFTPTININKVYKTVCVPPEDFKITTLVFVESNFDELELISYDSSVAITVPPSEPFITVVNSIMAPADGGAYPFEDAKAYIDIRNTSTRECTESYGEVQTNIYNEGYVAGSWESDHFLYRRTVPENYSSGQYVFRFQEVGAYNANFPDLYYINDIGTERTLQDDVWYDLYAPAGDSFDGLGTWRIYNRPFDTISTQSKSGVWDILIAVDDGTGNPLSLLKEDTVLIRWKGSYSVFDTTPAWHCEVLPATPIETETDSLLIWEGPPLVNWSRQGNECYCNMFFYDNVGNMYDYYRREYRFDAAAMGYYNGDPPYPTDNLPYLYYQSALTQDIGNANSFIVKVTHVSGDPLTHILPDDGALPSGYDTWMPSSRLDLVLYNTGPDQSILESVVDVTLAVNLAEGDPGDACIPLPRSEQTRRIKFIAERDDSIDPASRPAPDLTPPVDPLWPAKDPMKLLVRTPSDSTTFDLPLDDLYGLNDTCAYQFKVEWGDGDSDWIYYWGQPEASHVYATAGDYEITMSGIMPRLQFWGQPEADMVIEIRQWGDTGLKDISNMFRTCSNMTITATDVPNLSDCPTVTYCFSETTFVTGGLANWDVSRVENFSGMFYNCANFNEDIGSWNMCSARHLHWMFNGATAFDQDLSAWKVSNVRTFSGMFWGATAFNQPVNAWDMTAAETTSRMFSQTTNFNQPLDAWELDNLQDSSWMFAQAASFNSDISMWVFPRINDMRGMFEASVYNGDFSQWDITTASNLSQMFFNNTVTLGTGVSSWGNQLINQHDLSNFLDGATAWTEDITGWDVSDVRFFGGMFANSSFNQDISGWNVVNAAGMAAMFDNNPVFNRDVSGWQVGNVIEFRNMFRNATSFDQDLSLWNVGSGTSFDGMFEGAILFNSVVSSWDVSSGDNFVSMFQDATSFNQDVSSWDVSSGTSFDDMFFGATSFTTENYDLLLSNWINLPLYTNMTIRFSTLHSDITSYYILTHSPHFWTVIDLGRITNVSSGYEILSIQKYNSVVNGNQVIYSTDDTLTVTSYDSVVNFSTLNLIIPSSAVSTDLNNFTLRLDETVFPSTIWSRASANGRNITFYDGDVKLKRQTLTFDRTEQRCLMYVKIPTISSTSDTIITIQINTQEPFSDDPGSDVWSSGYKTVAPVSHGWPLYDMTGLSTIASRPEENGIVTRVLEKTGLANAQQGIAFDGTYWYVSDINGLYKYNTSWVLQASNVDPLGDMTATVTEGRDIDVSGGYIYLPCDNMTVGVFNSSDLLYVTEHDLTPQGIDCHGIVVEPEDNRVTITSGFDATQLHQYRLSDFSYISGLAMNESMTGLRGITRIGDHYYVARIVSPEYIQKVALDGQIGPVIYMSDSTDRDILGLCVNDSNELYYSRYDHTPGTNEVYKCVFDKTDMVFIGETGVYDRVSWRIDTGYPEAQIYLTSWGAPDDDSQRTIASFSNNINTSRFGLVVDSGNSFGTWANWGISWMYCDPVIDPPHDIMQHFGATYEDGGDRDIFYNGTRRNTSTAGNVPAVMNHLILGAATSGDNEEWSGIVREGRVMDIIPTDAWIEYEDKNVRNAAGILIVEPGTLVIESTFDTMSLAPHDSVIEAHQTIIYDSLSLAEADQGSWPDGARIQITGPFTNLLLSSTRLVSGQGAWTQTGLSVGSYTGTGLKGAPNTCTVLTDNDAAGYEYVTQERSSSIPNDSDTHIARYFVLKDNDETRFPEFTFILSGGTLQELKLHVNTKTGAAAVRTSTGTVAYEVNSWDTNWWSVVLSVQNNSSGNVHGTARVLPAAGTVLGTLSTSATGSITLGNAEMVANTSIAEFKNTDPIYSGDYHNATNGGATFIYNASLAVDGHSGLIHENPYNNTTVLTSPVVHNSETSSDPDTWTGNWTDSSSGTKGVDYDFDFNTYGRMRHISGGSIFLNSHNAFTSAATETFFIINNTIKYPYVNADAYEVFVQGTSYDNGVNANTFLMYSGNNGYWWYYDSLDGFTDVTPFDLPIRLWIYVSGARVVLWTEGSSVPIIDSTDVRTTTFLDSLALGASYSDSDIEFEIGNQVHGRFTGQ